jgi:hypothetical protein
MKPKESAMTPRHLCRAALLLAAFAMPAAAIAATPAAMTAQQPAMPKAMALKVEQHITTLHAQLAITPAEQPQWDQFAQTMRDNAAQMGETVDDRGTRMTQMNAAENMQSYATLAQVHADNMKKLSTSFGTLYSALSDEQKHVADTLFRNDHAHHDAAHKHIG